MTSVDFLMKGKLLAIPDYQHSLYADEEVFGESFPGSVEVIKMPADQQLPFYDVDGMKSYSSIRIFILTKNNIKAGTAAP